MALQSNSRTLAIQALCVLIGLGSSACSKSSRRHHGQNQNNVFSFVEAEPNDEEFNANYLGTLAIGETLIVRGYVEDTLFDPFDGFAVTAFEPLDVEFFLTSDDPFTDLDLCYYNPYSGQYEACWETSFNPEAGLIAMNGGEEFHLVVASYFGGSNYTLEIRGIPIGYAPAAGAPEASRAPDASGSATSRLATSGAAPARERVAPFEAYSEGIEASAAVEEPIEPSVRGRVIVITPGADGSDEDILSGEFALTGDV